MISSIYIEREIADHPRTAEILARFPDATKIPCERYGEVFNRRSQSFRLQKKRPALVLGKKHARHVLEAPAGYGIGGRRNYYFSHMLNCLYDCRYCFLQGMYRSAHYVVFVNYEDFFDAVGEKTAEAPEDDTYFFSGYDCDSLAFEAVTGFMESCLRAFRETPRAWLELRTKSTRIEPLRAAEPFDNCVVAWSFTPQEVSEELEHKVPSVERRLAAMAEVRERGWRPGLRFDPLIYTPDFEDRYRRLFDRVFAVVRGQDVHSVSLGPFRLPTAFFRRAERLYPDEQLFAGAFENHGGMVSYPRHLEAEIIGFCTEEILRRVPRAAFFPCEFHA